MNVSQYIFLSIDTSKKELPQSRRVEKMVTHPGSTQLRQHHTTNDSIASSRSSNQATKKSRLDRLEVGIYTLRILSPRYEPF
jgi:hypothetical protein